MKITEFQLHNHIRSGRYKRYNLISWYRIVTIITYTGIRSILKVPCSLYRFLISSYYWKIFILYDTITFRITICYKMFSVRTSHTNDSGINYISINSLFRQIISQPEIIVAFRQGYGIIHCYFKSIRSNFYFTQFSDCTKSTVALSII